ncbi:hypothetical protein HDV00_011248 [Rhizophlyctis rosea]|nr:hypothetical protein HDV00_011248 [Rhizophlyctis rosea]
MVTYPSSPPSPPSHVRLTTNRIFLQGGGGNYHYVPWVWRPWSGRWYAWGHNTRADRMVMFAIRTGVVIGAWRLSASLEDPEAIAFWKKQLEKEGREWIEPIPEWYPFANGFPFNIVRPNFSSKKKTVTE